MTGRYSLLFILGFALYPDPILAQTLSAPTQRQLARDLFQQLIEISPTSTMCGRMARTNES
jgi:hypothetical protein